MVTYRPGADERSEVTGARLVLPLHVIEARGSHFPLIRPSLSHSPMIAGLATCRSIHEAGLRAYLDREGREI